ncbi:hypothetical protein DOTSEDRAFT_27397 [Dothistroma septosporum NZE10]|uniref:Uncharacterized protein n=1 Tax=Dothistroma septosporum (strain NZE10 / CBS 128990) TaxID=675120 RepID=N1PHL6_DOTSN|nr:hypothetical protein DOTSEDRAFT_27397 [Dothistroma septosporum NZE10]
MLAITSSTNAKNLTPNILPCRIHHSGPIPTPSRYWNPSKIAKDGNTTQTSYFRGRKLLGKGVRLPAKYTGMVLQKMEKVLPQPPRLAEEDDEDEDEEQPVEVKTMEAIGNFDEVAVWGHEMLPQEREDVYVKGLQEWIGFAEAMHSYDDKDSTTKS